MKILELSERAQLTRRRGDILRSLDHDVLQDLGMSPNAALAIIRCVKCGIDITDFTDEECSAHKRYHQYMATAPKSIPHQVPQRRLEEFPTHDSAGFLWR